MASQKHSNRTSSKISSAASISASSKDRAPQSSISYSSFCPSHFQLSLFASVIQGLESQHLRVHDANTGSLRCDYPIASKATVSCLDWGLYRCHSSEGSKEHARKKRKRPGAVEDLRGSDVVIAYGMSDSEIQIFSPSQAQVMATLKGAHSLGIRDVKFVDGGEPAQIWSVGGDNKLVQWDIRTGNVIRHIFKSSL